MKRIIICCDGTWNSPGDSEDGLPIRTNVQKMFESICNTDDKGIEQIKYYTDGVGTSGSKLRRYLDGATGFGLDHNIVSAYKFLVWNFVKGDEIYLFGFSRGAYTARSLAGMIRNCGIIKNNDLSLIDQAYNYYRRRTELDWAPSGEKAIAFRERNSFESRIKFVGVWDTVGSLGIPLSLFRPYNASKYQFHDTTLSSYIDFAYHALAIDEKRSSFTPTLWIQDKNAAADQVNPQVLEQRWFCGVHSNIGGGYRETGLSDIAFSWMVEKAKAAGLGFEADFLKRYVAPNAYTGKLYNSLIFPFNITPKALREIKLDDETRQTIDQSVLERYYYDASYRPTTLTEIIKSIETDGEKSYWYPIPASNGPFPPKLAR
ncbi:DUF2235 domain-containing protein [Pedobacter agri]|uniref:DUF2235 domain-containing protein n=1 Tax=Pedobacter agri TaxID=454586 RepID=UPI00278B9525|nr:DUF2235 domain-containing protein [Pedobacter agri]MDQ1140689.1 uncharacterized protein (DUF2235 family) [Pedobacter agri]